MTNYDERVCIDCGADLRAFAEEWIDVVRGREEERGEVVGFPCCDGMRQRMQWGEAAVPSCVSDVVAEHTDAKFLGRGGTISYGIDVEVVSKTVANPIIERWHRHLGASHMGILGVVARNGGDLVGAATLATPTSRVLMNTGRYLEVNRIATMPGKGRDEKARTLRFNAVSKITAEMRRQARRLRRESKQMLRDLERGQVSMTERDIRKYRRRRGIERLRTYIFEFESGASLRAAGWKRVGRTEEQSWDRPSRERSGPKVKAAKTKYDTEI